MSKICVDTGFVGPTEKNPTKVPINFNAWLDASYEDASSRFVDVAVADGKPKKRPALAESCRERNA